MVPRTYIYQYSGTISLRMIQYYAGFSFFHILRLVKLKSYDHGLLIATTWTRESLDALLGHLREYGIELPKDSRTFKKTPCSVECIEKWGGQYTYFSIQEYIKQLVTSEKLKSGIDDIFFSADGFFSNHHRLNSGQSYVIFWTLIFMLYVFFPL